MKLTFLLCAVCGVSLTLSETPHVGDQAKPGQRGWAITPPKSYFHKFIPHPTGKNGFEDYVKCADEISIGQAIYYLAALDDIRSSARDPEIKVPNWARGRTYLDIEREASKRYEPDLELIAKGNMKPWRAPGDSISTPEVFDGFLRLLSDFKKITRVAVVAADAHLADADSGGAMTRLLDQLRFSNKFSRLGVIPNFVGEECDSIVLREIENNLNKFSVEDWNRLERTVRARLKERPPLIDALAADEPTRMKEISFQLEASQDPEPDVSDDEYGIKKRDRQAWNDLQPLNAAERQRAIRQAQAFAAQQTTSAETRLQGPVNQWPWPGDPVQAAPSRLVGDLAQAGLFDPVLSESEARSRVRMQIVIVHCLIQRYRIWHGSLPRTLQALNASKDIKDPLLGGTFKYEPAGSGYRLYSPGKGLMYPIELTTKPQLYPKIRAQLERRK